MFGVTHGRLLTRPRHSPRGPDSFAFSSVQRSRAVACSATAWASSASSRARSALLGLLKEPDIQPALRKLGKFVSVR